MPPETVPPAGGWVVHCDGSAAPNPGRMAWGAVLGAPDGTRHTLAGHAGSDIGCNNEAELRALAAALRALQALGAREVLLHSDNHVVVTQLTGHAPPGLARLAPLFDETRRLMASFPQLRLQWVPRHRNAEADALARQAAGLPPKAVLPPGSRPRRKNKR